MMKSYEVLQNDCGDAVEKGFPSCNKNKATDLIQPIIKLFKSFIV